MLSAALAALGKFFGGILPLPELFLTSIDFLISFAGISFLFALTFKYVPNTDIAFQRSVDGSSRHRFSLHRGEVADRAVFGQGWGRLGVRSRRVELIVVTVWVYYSSMIFFFGADSLTHSPIHNDQSTPDRRLSDYRCSNNKYFACAVQRHGLPAGANPARRLSLPPVAIGAVVEVTKRLKPSV